MRGLGYEGREKVVEEGDHVDVAEFGAGVAQAGAQYPDLTQFPWS